MKKKPENIKKGDMFRHLGLMWEVTAVRKEYPSKAFYAFVWVCPAGYVDCKMKLDIHLANQIDWLKPN